MIEFLHQNFGLPDGGLYSNLIASLILGVSGFFYGRAFEKRSIKRHNEIKSHIKRIHKHLGIK